MWRLLSFSVPVLIIFGLVFFLDRLLPTRSRGENPFGPKATVGAEQPSVFPSILAVTDVRPKPKPGFFIVDCSRTLTGSRLVEALSASHVANQGQFRPILSLDDRVPLKRLLDTLDVVGEAGISETFYTVPWSNSPTDFGAFGVTLATRASNPTDSNRVIVLSIREGTEDYTIDGEPVVSSLTEASWRLEAALLKRFGAEAMPTSLTVQVEPGIDPRRLHRALIGSKKWGFGRRGFHGGLSQIRLH